MDDRLGICGIGTGHSLEYPRYMLTSQPDSLVYTERRGLQTMKGQTLEMMLLLLLLPFSYSSSLVFDDVQSALLYLLLTGHDCYLADI